MNISHLKKAISISVLLNIGVFGIVVMAGLLVSPVTSLLSFPFAQIASLLKDLSLAGGIRNIISVALYVVICLVPIGYLLLVRRKRKIQVEDFLLLLLSLLLFIFLYTMVNPATLEAHFRLLGMGKELITFSNLVLLSVLISYLIFRLLRKFSSQEEGALIRHLKILVFILCIVTVFRLVGFGLFQVKDSIFKLKETNPGVENLYLSFFFLFLQQVVANIPIFFELVIFYMSFGLLEKLEKDFYSVEVEKYAGKLAQVSKHAVVWILVSQIGLNLAQFAFGSLLYATHFHVSIPIFSIALVLLTLLFAKYFERLRKLKEDVDSFI